MRVLIPELAEDAEPIAAALAAHGHEATVAPLVVLTPAADVVINLSNAQAFVVASPAAARALANRVGVRTFPAFADSLLTAAELQRVGFKRIETATDSQALAQLVQWRLTPGAGALVLPGAAGAPASVAALLTNVGFAVRPLALFTLGRVAALPADVHARLKNGTFDAVVFATADAARSFVTLVQREEIATTTQTLSAVAATSIVSAPLRALTFETVVVPERGDAEGFSASISDAQANRAARVAAERERERRAAEDARLAAEKAEAERRAAEVRAEAEKAAAEKQAALERQRAAEKVKAEKKAAAALRAQEEAARRAAEVEAERLAKAAAEKRASEERAAAEARERAHAEKRAAELQANEAAKAEAVRQRRAAEAERKAVAARASAEKRAQEEAEQLAAIAAAHAVAEVEATRQRAVAEAEAEAERQRAEAKAEAERISAATRVAAEMRAKEEAARIAMLEAARAAAEAAAEKKAAAERALVAQRAREDATRREEERLAEEKARIEQHRRADEDRARREAERLRAEAAVAAESARLLTEQTRRAEEERERAARERDETARVESDRALAAEREQRAKAEADARAVAEERALAEQAAREDAARQKSEREQAAAAAHAAAAHARTEKKRRDQEAKAQRALAASAARKAVAAAPPTVARNASEDTSQTVLHRLTAWLRRPAEVATPVAESPDMTEPTVPQPPSSATLSPPSPVPPVMDQHLPPSSPPELTPDPNPEPAPAVTPEPVSDLARASTPEAVAADVAVALRGRAARQQAEDAADASAKTQRWRGYGDLPGSEAVEEEPTTTVGVEQPTQQRPRGRLVPILVGIVALAGIGYAVFGRGQRAEQPANPVAPMAPQAAAPSITPPTTLPTTVGPAAADTQAQQVASLTARVATLEAALGNSARLQDVAKRIDTLESKSADASSVLALSERVNVLERTARTAIAEQGARIGQMLAVAQWREAVASGRPYVLELESVKALSARSGLGLVLDDPRVTAHAASGIATFVDLRDRFDDTAARVMRSGAVPQGVGGWLARSFDRMLSLMTIRRVDGLVEGNTPSAILARAGAQLRNSNLAACVTELEALTGPAADAAKLWLDEARARVAAEAAVNEASIKTIAALATDAAKSEP